VALSVIATILTSRSNCRQKSAWSS